MGNFQDSQGMQYSILMISVRADHGGGPRQLYQLIKGLKDEFKFFVACPRNEPYFASLEKLIGSERLIEIPYRRLDFQSFKRIHQKISSEKITLIHSHGKGAGFYSRLLVFFSDVRVVHTFHGIHIGGLNSIKRFFYIWLERCLGAFS